MKEEFVLPEKWCVKRTPENKDILNNWANSQIGVTGTSSNNGWLHSISYGFMGHTGNGHYYMDSVKHSDHTEITFEQFEKYVLGKEDMKEIIEYKLKEDCKQFIGAIDAIIKKENTFPLANGKTVLHYDNQRHSIGLLKEAKVLDLWFEPVYKEEFKVGDWVTFYSELHKKNVTSKIKDWGSSSYCYLENEDQPFKHLLKKATPEEIKAAQTLQFGGYDITFEKVFSGVRVICNGETGTFSQIEKIYKFAADPSKYKFGSADLKNIIYKDKSEWDYTNSTTPKNITIGCTTGTWEEFTAIYKKAKSML